jgi:pSer/pThr/pTyr-binding forkhead associated (FHA) protein
MNVQTLTFGTSDSCDVIVRDEYVSPKHMMATYHEEGHLLFVVDLVSTNGTWILTSNMDSLGTRVSPTRPQQVFRGQAVRIGRTIIPYGTL